MQCLLYGVGLGAGAVPVSAAINWILKDGLGQLGGVLYATYMNNSFDSDPKRVRFRAAVALQVCSFLELLTPVFPHLFLPLASISYTGKNISWIAASATRAQFHYSLMAHSNLGDVTARATTQTIACSVVGTAISVGLAHLVGNDVTMIMGIFLPVAALDIYANYRSCQIVGLKTFNEQRANIVLSDLLSNQKSSKENAGEAATEPSMMTPSEVAHREHFVNTPPNEKMYRIVAGPSIEGLASDCISDIVTAHTQTGDKYIVHIDGSSPEHWRLCVWLKDEATASDAITAYYHAMVLRRVVLDGACEAGTRSKKELLSSAAQLVERDAKSMLTALQAQGWITTDQYVFPRDGRIHIASRE